MRFSWTQPACTNCWDRRYNPTHRRDPVRLVEDVRSEEVCCFCGSHTWSGIYVRVDPAEVGYPTKLRENGEE